MKFSTTKKALLRAVSLTHSVAERKSPMPLLANILVSVDADGKLRLQATDTYVGASAIADVEASQPGSVAVPAKTLYDVVKSLPDGDLQWSLSSSTAIQIVSGRARFKLQCLEPVDFPPLPDVVPEAYASLHVATLADMIAKVSHAMSSDDTRSQLASALLESDGRVMRMVATDGHRMSVIERKIDVPISFHLSLHSTYEAIPSRGLVEIKRLLGDAKGDPDARVDVAFKSGHVFVRRSDARISVKLGDSGGFPPYKQLIPKSHDKRPICSRTDLMNALRRVALVASSGARLSLSSGSLRIAAENADLQLDEPLNADYDGVAFEIGLNAKYFLDALSAISCEDVALEMGGSLDPIVVRPRVDVDGMDLAVIMPMRV